MLFDKILISKTDVLKLITSNLGQRKRVLLTYMNQHCFNIYCTNKTYKNFLNNKFVVYNDGIGIKLAIRFLTGKKNDYLNASDLVEEIIQLLIRRNVKFFIIGGNFSREEFEVKFNHNPYFTGYAKGYYSDNDLDKMSRLIRDLNAEVVIIGMGVPKQELIAEKLSRTINASLFLCVGNFFEFYLGKVKRIPRRYRNVGVEWLYRIYQEPKRLWKRYVIGIPLFIMRVIKYKLILIKSS